MTYKILQTVGTFNPGEEHADTEFPPGCNFDRLIGLGAIIEVGTEAPPNLKEARRQLADANKLALQLASDKKALEAHVSNLGEELLTTKLALAALEAKQALEAPAA